MKKMKEYFERSLIIAVLGIFVLIALAVPATAAEGITEQWNITFGGAGDDYGYSVQQTADGGYILAGDTRSYGAGDADVWLIKTNSKGNEQWSRTFGGAEADFLDRGSVRQTSDGGYVITGYTYSYSAGDADVWLIKTDPGGNEQWNRTFGGDGLDWGHSVRQTSDGGYIIAGRIIPPYAGARADAWLIKTDSNGVEEWNRTFGADGCEYAASVQQTADGGYIMTGRTTSFGALEADAWLIRTDSNGIEQWNRTFGGAGYDYGYSVQQTSDGGYVIAGSTNGRQDVWLIKTRPDGTEEWNTIFGGPAKDEGYSVQQTSDGGYIIAGYTESYGTAGSADVWLIRTDSNGIEQWNRTVGGTGLEKGYSVHQTADGGYIVTGFTSSYGAGGYDLWLIKLSTPIVRQIDLLPTALEIPPTLYANLSNTISATIKNNGTGDASSFNVSLSADGSPVDEVVVSGLGAGESTAVSFSWTPSRTGDFELCVAADCDSNVNESKEGNNVLCKNVTVFSFEHPCWNDRFDDETKIAGKQGVILKDGDIKIDLDNPAWIWESDPSLVSGLGDAGAYTKPAIAFNITGDGTLNHISGNEDGEFYGFFWNNSLEQWISDSSLVAGLGDIGKHSAPALAFNITGEGRWNLISGQRYGHFFGFQGIRGSITSVAIKPSYFKNWAVFNTNSTTPAETSILYKILDEHNNTIMTIAEGENISSIAQTSIRLFAGLTTTDISNTPVLHDWSVCWETGEVDLLPVVIETPAELYLNVSWRISVAVKNSGEVHSGKFNVALYANDAEVDSKFINNIPAGESTNVTFEWTPIHAGNYNLTVIADSDSAIVETNETNNVLTKEVLVLPSNVRRLTFDLNSSINPGVATDSEGNVHVVWSEDRGGWKLYYKKLAPNGMVLVDDKRICSGSGARIAVDFSDEVHVVYSGGNYLKLDNDGNIVVGPKQFTSYSPRGIAVDRNGNVHTVVFFGPPGALPPGPGSSQGLIYVKLDNEGNELVNYTVESIHAPGYGTWDCMDVPSGIAVDSEGNAYTAYSKGSGNCGGSGCNGFTCRWPVCAKAWYAKIDGEGVHKQDLTGALPLSSLYPSVCVDSGDNKHVIWSQHNGSYIIVQHCPPHGVYYRKMGGYDFYYSKFDKLDNKAVNGKRLTYEDYPTESWWDNGYHLRGVRSPIIGTESGVIHAAWSVPEPKAGENKNIWYMAFDTSGGEMTNKTLISLEDGDSWEPGIAAVQDGSHLVWTDNRDGNNEIYSVRIFLPENRVFIICPSDKWAPPNVTATYAIGIMHTMPGSETFNLTLDNLDGADVAEFNKSTITLAPNDIGEVTLNVTDAVLGDYRVKVRAESQTNPEINAECTITTSVIVAKPDLIITAMDAYHNNTAESPWFNLSNEVDVTVKNIDTADASAFNVSLYADDEFVDKKNILGLGSGKSTTVQFKWTPIGADCFKDCTFTDSSKDYNLSAVADCDNEVNESDETNNNLTEVEKACYNGYMADEPLENVAHGLLHGGVLFTTGDGTYGGLYNPGDYKNTTYEVTLPPGASVVLARLNVYYTWHYGKDSCPAMEVSITNASGTYVVPLDRDYNDIKCQRPEAAWVFPWGNYVYNLTPHIQGSGTYTVTVKRTGGPSFCIAASGIEVLYKDETKPLIKYWINEGADVLIGGRRSDGGHLSLEECINNATFPGNINLSRVKSATLGVVSPWAGSAWEPGRTNYLYFNDIVLGQGAYHDETYEETIGSISMHIGSMNAQVGVNLSDVTDYLQASDNRVGQGDDGDCMMPSNAFLVVEYKEEAPPTPFLIYGWVNDSIGAPVLNPNVTITNLNTSVKWQAETNATFNYYQLVLANGKDVNATEILQFNATCPDGTQSNTTSQQITQDKIDNGGLFNFNLTLTAVSEDKPDLVVTDVWVCWPDNCTICYNLTNVGNGTAAPGHNTTLYVDGLETAQDNVPIELAPNASYIGCFDYTWAYTPPDDNIAICADYNNIVEETNEDNNWLNVTWKCGDVNNDKAVNILDVIQAYNKAPGLNEWAADVNADKAINILDVIKIYTKSGLICCCD